ncbi:hypothetical protein FRC11_012980, partial [Ceratobasidium sp. 423]
MLGKDANARFKAMPNVHGMQHFTRGIYSISQWTGHETKEMIKQFLPVIVDDLHDEIVELVRVLLDFISYAHSSSLTEIKLGEMMATLERFHELKPIIHECGLAECQEAIQIHRAYLEEHYGHFAPVPRLESRGDNLEEDLEAEEDRLPDVGIGSGLGVDIEGKDEVDEEKDKDGEDGTGVGEIEDALVGMQLDPVPEDRGGAVAYLQPVLAIASSPTRQGISGAELVDQYGMPDLIPLTTRFLERLGCRQSLTILNLFNVYN